MKAIKCNRCGNFQTTTSKYPDGLEVRAEVKIIIPPNDHFTKVHVEYLDLDAECTKELLKFANVDIEGV